MKIAIAREGNQISQHFGYCEGFELVEIEDGKVKGRDTVPNPGHKPGFLPVFLAEKGVNVIITGGMGSSAYQLFAQNGIEVITGIEGDISGTIDAYLSGTLQYQGGVCQSHDFKGECE